MKSYIDKILDRESVADRALVSADTIGKMAEIGDSAPSVLVFMFLVFAEKAQLQGFLIWEESKKNILKKSIKCGYVDEIIFNRIFDGYSFRRGFSSEDFLYKFAVSDKKSERIRHQMIVKKINRRGDSDFCVRSSVSDLNNIEFISEKSSQAYKDLIIGYYSAFCLVFGNLESSKFKHSIPLSGQKVIDDFLIKICL